MGKTIKRKKTPKNSNKHFVLKLISLTVGNYKPASVQFQNNSVNDAMLITINRVIV